MEILIAKNDLNIIKNGIGILRNECSGVECCPNGEDSGWTTCPESDITS